MRVFPVVRAIDVGDARVSISRTNENDGKLERINRQLIAVELLVEFFEELWRRNILPVSNNATKNQNTELTFRALITFNFV